MVRANARAFDRKMAAFRAQWLASDDADEVGPDGAGLPQGLVSEANSLVPRLVFRERIVASSMSGKRHPAHFPLRIGEAAGRALLLITAIALTAAGLHQVFRYAPQQVEALASSFSARDTAFSSP